MSPTSMRIPLEKMVLETDAPFLTPVPHRGRVNRPEYLVETLKFIAKARGESLNLIAAQTSNTAEKLFNI